MDKTRHDRTRLRILSDTTRSRADLIVENALLWQQLIVLQNRRQNAIPKARRQIRIAPVPEPGYNVLIL
jgi:hypothetical protein